MPITVNDAAEAPVSSASLSLGALDGTNGFVINGIDASDASGFSVSGAGDINGDGFADIVVGAYQGDPHSDDIAGETYVVFGSNFTGAVTQLGTALI